MPGASDDSQLLWFDRQGRQLGPVDQPTVQTGIALSPDSKRVAVTRLTHGVDSIWLLETAGGGSTRFTPNRGGTGFPVWSPDGGRIAFTATLGVNRDPSVAQDAAIYQKPSSGAGMEELLVNAPFARSEDWSSDGSLLAYTAFEAGEQKTRLDLWLLALDQDRKPVPFIHGPASESSGRFSPGDDWMAYVSDETGKAEVYVQRVPDLLTGSRVAQERTVKQQVSVNGGQHPCWRPDGLELFYIAADGKLMAVQVNIGSAFAATPPHAVFQARIPALATPRLYAVSANGQRFLINTQVNQTPTASVIALVHWQAGINR